MKRGLKKGVSPIIAEVLLIMITIIAASIIAGFVIAWLTGKFNPAKDCFDVANDLRFYDTPYNCFNATFLDGRTGFSVQIDDNLVKGIQVALFKGGISDSYTIADGAQDSNIRMLYGNFSGALEIPKNGGVRTYVAKGVFERIEISPILESGTVCDLKYGDTLTTIDRCIDQTVNANITSN